MMAAPVWWIWLSSTMYNERYEQDDVSHRIATFAKMIPIGVMAVTAANGLDKAWAFFACSYIAQRAIMIFLWLRAGRGNKLTEAFTQRLAAGFTFSLLLWTISIFIPAPYKYMLCIAGLLTDMFTPIFTFHIQSQLPLHSVTHLPERFGLLAISVLGEAVVASISGNLDMSKVTERTVALGLYGLSVAFSLWWIYFDVIFQRRIKKGLWYNFIWWYMHLPLVMGITALGASLYATVGVLETTADSFTFVMFGSSLAVVHAAMGVMEGMLVRGHWPTWTARLGIGLRFGSALLFATAAIGGLSLTLQIVLVIVMLLVQLVHATRMRFYSAFSDYN
jgi:low temperature requirement protein LtrA